MPWKDQIKRFKSDWDKFNQEHNILPGSSQQQSPAQYYQNSQSLPPSQQQPQQQQQQYYYNNPAPLQSQPYYGPPPSALPSHPYYESPAPGANQCVPQDSSQPPVNTICWQPRFEPGVPISQEWDAKIGSGKWGNNELEFYTANPENAFFTNERKLIIRAIANNNSPNPDQKYTSARLVSRQTLSRDSGVLTAVLSSPCATGIWPAFWLLPEEPFKWPEDGEIDIAETWNGDCNNKSCLHWGAYTAQDASKHRTMGTQINDMGQRPVRYDWAWEQADGTAGQGRMIWWIDGRPVMKATMAAGTRALRDWTVLLNVAIGGDVCGGQRPRDGAYDLVVHTLYISSEPEQGGWSRFENDWHRCPDGNPM